MTIIQDRRKSVRNDPAFMLALLFTFGFLGMMFLVVLRGVPNDNVSIVQQLISIMSMIQAGIGGFYYGMTKTDKKPADGISPPVPPVDPLPGEPSKGI